MIHRGGARNQTVDSMELAAFISAGIAAAVTIAVCMLVDHYGGTIAGVIGTVPHVAVVGSVGFAAVLPVRDFKIAVLAMPVGMLCNSLYAAAMIAASSLLPRRGVLAGAGWQRLLAVVASGLCVFAVGLALLLAVVRPKERPLGTAVGLAVASWGLEAVLGAWTVWAYPSAPRGDSKSSWWQLLGRGCVTFCVFLLALYLATKHPAAAGVLVNLPIVTTVVVVSVWRSTSEAVAVSCLGPMILGMLSASMYALLASDLIPRVGTGGGAVASWFAAVVGVTLPVLWALQRLRKRRAAAAATKAAAVTAAAGVGGSSSEDASTETELTAL